MRVFPEWCFFSLLTLHISHTVENLLRQRKSQKSCCYIYHRKLILAGRDPGGLYASPSSKQGQLRCKRRTCSSTAMPCLLVSPKQDSVLQMWSCNYWLVANNHVPCPSVYAYAKPTKTAQYEFGRLSHHVARQSHVLDLLCTRTLTRFSAEQHPDSPSPARITTSDYSIPLQDFALAFLELHQVSTSPFPRGSPSFWTYRPSSQIGAVWKLIEGAFHPIAQTNDKTLNNTSWHQAH